MAAAHQPFRLLSSPFPHTPAARDAHFPARPHAPPHFSPGSHHAAQLDSLSRFLFASHWHSPSPSCNAARSNAPIVTPARPTVGPCYRLQGSGSASGISCMGDGAGWAAAMPSTVATRAAGAGGAAAEAAAAAGRRLVVPLAAAGSGAGGSNAAAVGSSLAAGAGAAAAAAASGAGAAGGVPGPQPASRPLAVPPAAVAAPPAPSRQQQQEQQQQLEQRALRPAADALETSRGPNQVPETSRAPDQGSAASPSEQQPQQPPRGFMDDFAPPPLPSISKSSSGNSSGVLSAGLPLVLPRQQVSYSSSRIGDGDDELVDVTCQRRHSNPILVLMRHGESMWNDLKLFTGDVDIPLTEKGVMEALAGGRAVAEIDFSVIFTSRLMRSKQTALLAMTQNSHKAVPVIVRGGFHGNGKTGDANRLRLRAAAAQAMRQAECRMIPVYADPALNERCYGDLQGLNKEAAARTFGHDLVAQWRRSHDTRPPHGESLKDTWERTLAFHMSTIEPRLKEGRNVLVVAHGNVLRCIVSYLCHLTEQEMLRLQIATALPYTFSFDGSSYAQVCVLPPIDPRTNSPRTDVPMGLTSGIKKNNVDSLI